jgi:hypothetical protein
VTRRFCGFGTSSVVTIAGPIGVKVSNDFPIRLGPTRPNPRPETSMAQV